MSGSFVTSEGVIYFALLYRYQLEHVTALLRMLDRRRRPANRSNSEFNEPTTEERGVGLSESVGAASYGRHGHYKQR